MEHFPSHMFCFVLNSSEKKLNDICSFRPPAAMFDSMKVCCRLKPLVEWNHFCVQCNNSRYLWSFYRVSVNVPTSNSTLEKLLKSQLHFLFALMCAVKYDIWWFILIGSSDLCWTFTWRNQVEISTINRLKFEERIKSSGHFSCVVWNLLNQFSTFTSTFMLSLFSTHSAHT